MRSEHRSSSSLPPLELVTILVSMEPGLVAVTKSILQSAGIPYVADGEGPGRLYYRGRIRVGREDAADAGALLKDLQR